MTYKINVVNAVRGGETYLITSGDDAVLIDTGYAAQTDGTIDNINKHLGSRNLSAILLTHSHYDHVMGYGAISEFFADAKTYAHPRVSQIFAKPTARKFMEEMNKAAAAEQGVSPEIGWAEKLRVDVEVQDNQAIDIGDMRIRVIYTPGHTACSISLYFENDDLLVASETLGVAPDFPRVVPGFIVSYEDAIRSIRKIGELHPGNVLLPHGYVISGDDIDLYIKNAQYETDRVHEIAVQGIKDNKTCDQIVDIMKGIYYKGNFRKYQPDEAFYANWIPMINKIMEKETARPF